jgi:hypothetical protein
MLTTPPTTLARPPAMLASQPASHARKFASYACQSANHARQFANHSVVSKSLANIGVHIGFSTKVRDVLRTEGSQCDSPA